MRLHRFIRPFDISKYDFTIEDVGFAHQLKNVLRFGAGDRIILADGKLHEAELEITEIKKDTVSYSVKNRYENINEPSVSIVLYFSILRGEHTEMVLEKCTELGVAEFVPIISERTIKDRINKTRAEKIILEAAEQSGRGIVPLLSDPISFEDAILKTKGAATYFFDTGEEADTLRQITGATANIMIGPEGGWTVSECEEAKKAGLIHVSLGKLTLRAETAAIVGVSRFLIMNNTNR